MNKTTKNKSQTNWTNRFEWLPALFFGTTVFLFFAFAYRYHLNYQEQFQLFLFNADYLATWLSHPGGLSDYIGNFFTQFYFYSWFGALEIAVLLTILQTLVWYSARKTGALKEWMPLSFVPSFLYWSLLCDENYMLGGLIALLMVAGAVALFLSIRLVRYRMIWVLVFSPILYWIAGGAFILLPLFAIAYEAIHRQLKPAHYAIFAFGAIVTAFLFPFLAKWVLVQYPLLKFWTGVNYFRFPVIIPYTILVIALLVVAIPLLARFLSDKTVKVRKPVLFFITMLLIFPAGYFLVKNSADLSKEEVMAYDFNVRMRKWDTVLKMADKKTPSSPLSVTCLNLSLAKMDLLGERMFNYYQNGEGGLMPDFTRDFTIPLIAGEVYYHLGFINTAQRYAFEAMEALPDYQKSVRGIMRLAETNIINENYSVAAKYLKILQQTFYYRGWATNALETIRDEQKIEQHPEWGYLRKVRTQEDFLFSEKEKDMMLGVLFRQHHENRMAFEYLMAYYLLAKDLQKFQQLFSLSKELNYKHIPKHFQEALLYVWNAANSDHNRRIPYPISDVVAQRLQMFGRIVSSQPNAQGTLQDKFSDTYWFYLHYRN